MRGFSVAFRANGVFIVTRARHTPLSCQATQLKVICWPFVFFSNFSFQTFHNMEMYHNSSHKQCDHRVALFSECSAILENFVKSSVFVYNEKRLRFPQSLVG